MSTSGTVQIHNLPDGVTAQASDIIVIDRPDGLGGHTTMRLLASDVGGSGALLTGEILPGSFTLVGGCYENSMVFAAQPDYGIEINVESVDGHLIHAGTYNRVSTGFRTVLSTDDLSKVIRVTWSIYAI